MAAWSSSLIQEFAPGLPSLTNVEIPDLAERFPQAPHWLGNHVLNSVYSGGFGPIARQIVFATLRRAFHAFEGYHAARQATADCLAARSAGSPSIQAYYQAVALWETFALQTQMAIDLVNWLNSGHNAFAPNDGSREQRLYSIGNHIKHTRGSVVTHAATHDEVLPLWLSNTGLHSFDADVSFAEAAEILADLATIAGQLEDPHTFISALRAARAADNATR